MQIGQAGVGQQRIGKQGVGIIARARLIGGKSLVGYRFPLPFARSCACRGKKEITVQHVAAVLRVFIAYEQVLPVGVENVVLDDVVLRIKLHVELA